MIQKADSQYKNKLIEKHKPINTRVRTGMGSQFTDGKDYFSFTDFRKVTCNLNVL